MKSRRTVRSARVFDGWAWSLLMLASFILMSGWTAQAQRGARGVRVVTDETARRVDIFVAGQPFTSYIWPDTIKKPVLYPLRAATGTEVTRGFPLDPRAGERADHPHQIGFWLNYGDVNGADFWNNSTARTPAEQTRMGTIVHRRVVRTQSGRKMGALVVEMDWLMPDGQAVLRETTKFIFRFGPAWRAVDRVTTLTALSERVVFKDSKEGMLGLRVRRELEQQSDEPLILTDVAGRTTRVAKEDSAKMNSAVVTGQYLSSEGKAGDAVWGTRGRWAMLTGRVGQEQLTLALLDHPRNIGYPTYWMARGYGLFAANPLGAAAYTDGKERLNFTLEPGQSATFRYRLLLLSGSATPEQVEKQYRRFINEVK